MTIELDAGTAGGIVLIITAIVGGIIKIIAEVRGGARSNDTKLKEIKATTEESAKKVDGNLTAVREEMAGLRAENKTLHQTVTTLSSALSAAKTAEAITASRRATDKPPVSPGDNADVTGT